MNKDILKEIKVLYVEDEEDVRNFTAKTLGSLVKEIQTAQNGLVGLEAYTQDNSFDLILTDINMPKMGGLEMCAEIKKLNPYIPIVITSAYNDPAFLQKAIDVGVTSYAMKPVDLYKLVESIVKAVEPLYLKKELEKTNKELQQLNASLENKVQERTVQLRSILDSQDNIIVVSSEDTIDMVNKRFYDFFDLDPHNSNRKNSHCIAHYFEKDDEYFYIKDSQDEHNWMQNFSELPEVNRVVKMKNKQGQHRIFAVHFDTYEHAGDHFVISFSDITEIKEKSKQLEYQATHDQLTGIFNRQKFHELFCAEIERNKRYNNQLCVIMFDIDHFKDFNDQYGHQLGDKVLIKIAQEAQESIRATDAIARWGGEEFLILLPQTDIHGATQSANKLRENIANIVIEGVDKKVTSSFGVSSLKKEDSLDTIIKRVDDALYSSKKQGRNTVSVL